MEAYHRRITQLISTCEGPKDSSRRGELLKTIVSTLLDMGEIDEATGWLRHDSDPEARVELAKEMRKHMLKLWPPEEMKP